MSTVSARPNPRIDDVIAEAMRGRGLPVVINAEFRGIVAAYCDEKFGIDTRLDQKQREEVVDFVQLIIDLSGADVASL